MHSRTMDGDEDRYAALGIRPSARVKTAAALLDCDESHIRLMLKSGQLEGHRIGVRGVRVYVDSIAALQAGRPIEATGAIPKLDRPRVMPAADDKNILYLKKIGLL